MAMKYITPCITALLLLSSCNLTASLTGGGITHTFNPTYEASGEQHSLEITFEVKDGIITELTIEPGAVSTEEHAHQMAFIANVRQFVLGRSIEEIELPEVVGNEEKLTEVFRVALEKLSSP